jgi:hypothetical protein
MTHNVLLPLRGSRASTTTATNKGGINFGFTDSLNS